MFKRKKKFSKDILRARRLSWITITLILLAGTGAWFWYQTRAASRINTTRDAFSENLIGYWKMDEGTGTSTTADASVSGNNLTMTSMESGDWVAGNRSPYALDFDGSAEYLTIADPSSGNLDFTATQSFTIAGWFSRDTTANNDTLVAKKNTSNGAADPGYLVWIESDDRLNIYLSDGTTTANPYVDSPTALADGWHHFALIVDRSSQKVTTYLDGSVGSNISTAISNISAIGSLANALAFRIGAQSDAGDPFDGRIDDVRMYNRAFSSDEVMGLYRLASPGQTEDATLMGHWTFDGGDSSGTSTFDRSGRRNDGVSSGTPLKGAGVLGQAIDFDGVDDHVNVANPSTASLDFGDTADFSVSGWFNRDTFASDHTIIAKRNGQANTDDGYIVYIDDTDDKLHFEVSDTADADEYEVASTATFTTAGWHHFAVVWDQDSAANTEIYIDGIAGGTDTGTIGNIGDLTEAIDLRIGSETDGGARFDGKLDDIRIWNRALSSAEALSAYNSGTTVLNSASSTDTLAQSLAGYWKMDEGTGTSSTADASGNANNLSMTNMESGDWVSGQVGSYGLDFDGSNEYLTVADPNNMILDFGDDTDWNHRYFTLTGWFNRDTFANDHTIIAKKNDQTTNQGYIAWIDDTDDKLYFEISDGTDTYQVASTTTFTATGWHQFVLQWDDIRGMKVYIDGNLDNTNTASTTSIGNLDNALAFCIGAESDAGNPFDGKLDDIRVYGRLLPTSDIALLYKSTAPTEAQDASLIAHWTFDGQDILNNTADGTIINSARTAYNLTITGGGARTTGPGLMGQSIRSNAVDGESFYSGWVNGFGVDVGEARTYAFWHRGMMSGKAGFGWNEVLNKSAGCHGPYVRSYWNSGSYYIGFNFATGTGCSEGVNMTTYSVDSQTFSEADFTNKWHHYVWVIDRTNTSIRLYVDGVEVDTSTVDNTADSAPGAALYLSSAYASTNGVDGYFDDFRIYNDVLSAGEVRDLYNLAPTVTINAAEGDSLSKGLSGYWKMDEGTGISTTADASGNATALTMTNMESGDWVTGQIGPYALDFDGSNEYLSVTDASLPDDEVVDMYDGAGGSNYFTLTGWFNRDTFANDHTIIAKKNDQTTSQGYVVWIDGTDDKLYFEISDGTDTYQVASTTTFTATGWHQFAVVWNDSVGMKAYIDGRLDNSNSASTASINSMANALDFRIGAESDAGNPFDGKLDDIRIYQRILSIDEIRDLYLLTAPLEIRDTSLVAHYTFDANDMYGKTMMNRGRLGYNAVYTDGDGTDNSVELARTGAAPGISGQGFRSDGGNQHYFYIGTGNSPMGNFGVDHSVTYSWWFNEENGSPGNGIMWDKATGCVGAFFWRNSGFYRGSFTYDDDPTTCTDQVTIVVETPTGVTYPNGWHMLTWIIDRPNTVMKLYMDAVLVDTETVNNTYQYVNEDADFTLGGVEWFSSWKGVLDDFRIYNRALSLEEIMALYQRTGK